MLRVSLPDGTTRDVPVPENMDWTAVKAVVADDGTVTVVPDTELITARQWAAVREQRDQMLAKCDWTQLADAHLSVDKKQAWSDYRQALRDIPEDFEDPTQVQWPTIPGATPTVQASGARVANLMEQI